MEQINTQVQADMEEKSSEAALELMKQSGWDIVNELARVAADQINSTALVVLPVSVNLDKYKAALTDPEGFESKFNTLRNDVNQITKALLSLHAQHETKEGAPTEDELELVKLLTLGYTKIQGHIETAVQPLILNLIDQLENVGITELTIEE